MYPCLWLKQRFQPNSPRCTFSNKNQGFTLLELLLVIMVMGYLVSLVKLPAFDTDPFEQVEKVTQRLAVQINLASEQAVLQQQQLGIALSDSSYQFLFFDEEGWQPLAEPIFSAPEAKDNIQFQLSLDGLSWQQDNLLSAIEFINEEDQEALAEVPEEQRWALFPQIFLLSSGELTPFDLKISYNNGFDEPITFLIRGQFTTPVNWYDPQQQLELEN